MKPNCERQRWAGCRWTCNNLVAMLMDAFITVLKFKSQLIGLELVRFLWTGHIWAMFSIVRKIPVLYRYPKSSCAAWSCGIRCSRPLPDFMCSGRNWQETGSCDGGNVRRAQKWTIYGAPFAKHVCKCLSPTNSTDSLGQTIGTRRLFLGPPLTFGCLIIFHNQSQSVVVQNFNLILWSWSPFTYC